MRLRKATPSRSEGKVIPSRADTPPFATRMERHASCSAWDEDHETDDVMAEVLTRSASAAQREAREPLPPPLSSPNQPEPARNR